MTRFEYCYCPLLSSKCLALKDLLIPSERHLTPATPGKILPVDRPERMQELSRVMESLASAIEPRENILLPIPALATRWNCGSKTAAKRAVVNTARRFRQRAQCFKSKVQLISPCVNNG